ncbi:MAG: hypothetical protein QOJ09_2467, partial [Actinomycetota bacterium]|nr:hypothetical protein [Actinomycetota bacterium]
MLERLVDAAVEGGVPVLGVIDSSGADATEGVSALHAWGRVAASLARASGMVPIVLVVVGPCVSGPALLLGLADVVVMTEDSFAYVSGPGAVREAIGLDVSHERLGGAAAHALVSGVATLVAADEDDAMLAARDVLVHLPANNCEAPPELGSDDPVDRDCTLAARTVPVGSTSSYDVRVVAGDVVDHGSFFELWPRYAPSLVTAFATIEGRPVGVLANQPQQLAGTLTIEASQKGARFVQLCDAFNLPLLTFVDTPG